MNMNTYSINEIGAPFDNNIAQIETIHFGGCVPQKINLDLDDDNRWMNGAWIQRRQRNQHIQIHTGFLINDDMTWITGFAEHMRNTTATIRVDEPREEIKEPEVEVAVEELEGRELLEYQYNQMRPLVVHEDVVLVPDDEDEDEDDDDDDDEDEAENIFYTASKIVKNIFEFFQFKEKND